VSSGRGWRREAAGSAAPRDPPPLRIWIATALVLSAFFTVSIVSFSRHEDQFLPYNRARVAAFAEHEPSTGSYRVVALGDSRLKYATLNERELTGLAESFGIPDLRFLRIVENAATYRRFEGLADPILTSRPDLLLIQLDVIFRERALLTAYEEYKSYLTRWIRHLLWGFPLENPEGRQIGIGCAEDEPRERLWAHATTYERRLYIDPSSRNVDGALRLARRAQQAGTDVAFLEIHSSPELRAHFRGTGLDDREALDRLRRASDLPIWRFPPELANSEHYCDYIHLNAPARVHFSHWLIGRIAAATRPG
jgi:hypothetical protein